MNDNLFEDEKNKKIENTIITDNQKKTTFNKKYIFIILGILLGIIILTIIVKNTLKNVNSNNNDIVINDTVTILENTYDISKTEELVLDENSLSIMDINNISKLENLKKLDIKNVILDDISFISKLKKLNVIKISVNSKVIDFSVLNNLNNLFTLEIYGGIGKSADLSAFNNLDKVSTLYLTIENDRDISFLNEMSGLSLVSLDCSTNLYNEANEILENTKIKLQTHGELSKIDIKDTTEIEDGIINWSQYDFETTEVISILITEEYSEMKKLQSELDKISNYTNLKNLTISASKYGEAISIENLDFLKQLKKLENLHIDYLNVNNTNAIGELTNLKVLSLTNGNMANTKFTEISKLVNLTDLNLSMQNITNISFVSNLKNLTKLNLNGNNITDITTLKNTTKLKELYLGCNNNLTSFKTIETLENLETLMITPNTLDLRTFTNLKNLKNVYVGISFETLKEFKSAYPNISITMVSECV